MKPEKCEDCFYHGQSYNLDHGFICRHKGSEDYNLNHERMYKKAPYWCKLKDVKLKKLKLRKTKISCAICPNFGKSVGCCNHVRAPVVNNIAAVHMRYKQAPKWCPRKISKCHFCDSCNTHTRKCCDTLDLNEYLINKTTPAWCPKAPTIKKERTMKDFDLDENAAQVKNNAMNALNTSKAVIIQMQQGAAVNTAIKEVMKKAPGCPDNLKMLLETPYGDLAIGLIVHTVAPVLTGSPAILKAVKAANIAGAIEVSRQFTFIQDSIIAAVASVPGFEDIKGVIKEKVMPDQGDNTDA